LAFGLMAAGQTLPRRELILLAVLVLWGAFNIGGIFDRRLWAFRSELARLPVTAGSLALVLPSLEGYVPLGLVLGLALSWYTLVQYRAFLQNSPRAKNGVILGAAAQPAPEPLGPPVAVASRAAN
jgi:hypothetical protein